MKKLNSFVLLMLFSIVLFAQKSDLSLSDAVLKQYSELRPDKINNLQWTKSKGVYSFEENDQIVIVPVSSNDKINISKSDISQLLINTGGDSINSLPTPKWYDENSFYFENEGSIVEFDYRNLSVKTGRKFNDNAANKDYNNNLEVAYTIENNLYILNKEGKNIQITSDSEKTTVNGQAVHRFEFGIEKGTFWSPNGKKLAYYRKDESMVTDYPLVSDESKPSVLKSIKYPMAGMTSHHVQLAIYDLNTGKTVILLTGAPDDHYLTNVGWGPDSKFIYLAEINRDQNHVRLNKYNAESGKLEATLFEEKHEKYVEPQKPVRFLLKDKTKFIWQSERDGFDHLYIYNTSGKLIKQLTKGEWVVQEVFGVDPSGENLMIMVSHNNALESRLMAVGINSDKKTMIGKGKGLHRYQADVENKLFIDSYHSLDNPGVIDLIDSKGKKIKQLHKSSNPLEGYKTGKTELVTFKSADGKWDLNGRIIKPYDFDETKKYPVLVYVYGGPRVQLIHDSWLGDARLWMHYFANKGYIIFSVDSRGSENRGRDFEQSTFRQLGTVEIEDQMKGVEYLHSLPYINKNKMAVHGWSYGGFMTTSLMLKQPGVFKVGVSGGPVIDWKFYEIMYTERYMDTPESNPEGYQEASLLNKAKSLEGNLMLIHGTVDDVVVMQHSTSFLKSCIDDNVQVDFFVYPGHPHNVRGKDRVHLMTKVLNYIEDKLKD